MGERKKTLVIAATGTANLASIVALCARAGVDAVITSDPVVVAEAEYALLPGVGAFGPAMANLRACRMDLALKERWIQGKPLMGICLGMQMMCRESEEAPGVPGLGFIPVTVQKFRGSLPLPQLGWNSIVPETGSILQPGWAYFANSFRISEMPATAAKPGRFVGSQAQYGETFVASIEFFPEDSAEPTLLLCQFHPELSGSWGEALFRRWMRLDQDSDGGHPHTGDEEFSQNQEAAQ